MQMLRVATVFGTLAFSFAASAALAEPKMVADPGLSASDTALLQDQAKAAAEFQRRLHDQVHLNGGVLVIQDRTGTTTGVTVMPATVIWGIDCGDSGLAITFGTGSGDTDNGIVLQLTGAAMNDAQCLQIAPAVGQAALAISKGN
jgi:hypothetical protein